MEAAPTASPARVPAWKKLGLKLTHQPEASRKRKIEKVTSAQIEDSQHSSPLVKRKKSVTFAQDVKEDDGNQDQRELDTFIAEQQGKPDQFTVQEASQFSTNASHLVNHKVNGKTRKSKATVKEAPPKSEQDRPTEEVDPQSEYLRYLIQFGNDKANWKFKKHNQIALLKYTFSERRIPSRHFETYLTYIDGLQGQARQRLAERAQAVIDEPDSAQAEGMEAAESRDAARSNALKQQLLNSKIRLRENRDDELLDDPDFRARYTKRRRAEEILKRLADVSAQFKLKIPEADASKVAPSNQVVITRNSPNAPNDPGKRKRVRIKKARSGVPEDDMSSVSSVELGPLSKRVAAARAKAAGLKSAARPDQDDTGDASTSSDSSEDSTSDSDSDNSSTDTDTDSSSDEDTSSDVKAA